MKPNSIQHISVFKELFLDRFGLAHREARGIRSPENLAGNLVAPKKRGAQQARAIQHAGSKGSNPISNKELLARFKQNWPGLLENLADRADGLLKSAPFQVKGGILSVAVETSVHLTELQFQKKRIERRIAKYSSGQVSRIKLKYQAKA